jgi:uncharacterized membrane protein
MRAIFIMIAIVVIVAIVMYGIVQIKRGKVETPSQVTTQEDESEEIAEETFTVEEE